MLGCQGKDKRWSEINEARGGLDGGEHGGRSIGGAEAVEAVGLFGDGGGRKRRLMWL